MSSPAHLYPLCENCGATICPPAAEFSCEHVCGASRVAPEALRGASSIRLPGASASGPFGRRFRRSFKLTHSFRAHVAQICGPCNARVAPEIKLACDALAKKFGARPA